MRRHFYACAVATLFLLAASGCYHAKARIEAGSASGSLNSPTELSAALNLLNTGEADAGNVQAIVITVSGGTVSTPNLPATIGNIAKDGNAVLGAAFTGSFQADTSYTIHVEGTFDENGHNFKFATDATLQTPPGPGSVAALSSSSPANLANGAHFPYQPPNFPKEVNEGGLGWTVPTGPNRPLMNPPSASSGVQPAPKGDPPGFDMEVDNSLGLSGGNTINEPSGAVSPGGIVFETANSYAAWSKDGVHFTQLQPTTIFPNNADGGFCCDQIVVYAPSVDRFIWVMQYWQGSNGQNRYRIAAASPATVQSSNGTSWTYWDITSAQIGAGTGWVDYPDLSLGNNNVYLSADVVKKGGGRYVVRIPLSQIQAGGTINFNYTDYTKGSSAYGGHLAQNAQDEEFWAGQNSNSQIRVFQWPESSGNYSWTDVNIGSWPQPAGSSSSCSSTTPDGQDWLNKLLTSFPGNAVLGATRLIGANDRNKQNELLLAWTACAGSNFPQPQVQWVALDVNNNFNLLSQQQIWNPNYAFAYPAFGVNANNDIGMSLEWGGGGNYENHVVGFWGDYVVYATTNSTVGTGRFGDYVTLRPYPPDNKRFSAYGYGITGSGADTHYVVFSRPGQ
jgi:hypothetical protein